MKKLNNKAVWLILAAIIIVVSGGFVRASASGDDSKDVWQREKLSGDWYGVRSDLADRGLKFDAKLIQFFQGVTSGGTTPLRGECGGSPLFLCVFLSWSICEPIRMNGQCAQAPAGAATATNMTSGTASECIRWFPHKLLWLSS